MTDDFRDDSEHDLIAARLLIQRQNLLDFFRRSQQIVILMPVAFEAPPEDQIHVRVPGRIDWSTGSIQYTDGI